MKGVPGKLELKMYKKNKEEISKKEMIELSKKGLSPLTMDMKELEGITHIEIQN